MQVLLPWIDININSNLKTENIQLKDFENELNKIINYNKYCLRIVTIYDLEILKKAVHLFRGIKVKEEHSLDFSILKEDIIIKDEELNCFINDFKKMDIYGINKPKLLMEFIPENDNELRLIQITKNHKWKFPELVGKETLLFQCCSLHIIKNK
jgi:hypothetical protein